MSRGWRVFWSAVALLVLLAGTVFLLIRERPLWLAVESVRFHLWRSGTRSRYIEVSGQRLHYFEAAPPDGTPGVPLVLVHGLGARSEDWAPMIPTLAASGFHVYAPDLLGYGRSARPADADFGIGLEEGVVAGFLHAVGLTHASVAGWSMGGWITMKLALDHPDLVDRVVIYDSAGVYFQAAYDFSVFTPTDAAGVQKLLALLMPRPPALPAFVMRDAVRTLGQNAWVVHRSVAAMTSGRELLDFRLYALRQPMLIVWGEQDSLIPPSAGQAIHRLVPGSVLALEPGCGHLAPAQCATPILKETIAFLRSEPPMRGGEITLPSAR